MPRARNPQTGEELELVNGQWIPVQPGQPPQLQGATVQPPSQFTALPSTVQGALEQPPFPGPQQEHPLAPWANLIGKVGGPVLSALEWPDKHIFEPYITKPARYLLEKAGMPETVPVPEYKGEPDPLAPKGESRNPSMVPMPLREAAAQAPSWYAYSKLGKPFEWAGRALKHRFGKMAEAPAAIAEAKPAAVAAEPLKPVDASKADATLLQDYDAVMGKAGLSLEGEAAAGSVLEPAAKIESPPWMQDLETPTFMRRTLLQPRGFQPSTGFPRTGGPLNDAQAEKFIESEMLRKQGPVLPSYGPGRGPATEQQWNSMLLKRPNEQARLARLKEQTPDVSSMVGLGRLLQTVRGLGR